MNSIVHLTLLIGLKKYHSLDLFYKKALNRRPELDTYAINESILE